MDSSNKLIAEIGATDSSAAVLKNAAANFSNLWEQIAAGNFVAQGISQALDLIASSIQNDITTAANFQSQMTQLVTGAGESQSNLKLVGDGINKVAEDTGTTLDQLTQGMYMIESAGFHGQNGINVLRAAAEGAKADGADLQTVGDALTTILHNYNLPASQAVAVTNQMVMAVALGKMHMQDFASSLSTVLPIAHQVGLSFSEIAGAEATLTAGGVTASQATQDLSALIRGLQSPTLQQTQLMQQLGLSSLDLAQNLGKKGLSGTLQEISDAIAKNMGPDGLVIQKTMQDSKVATQDLQIMLKGMPSSLKGIATELMNGTISFTDYKKAVQALPEGVTNLGKEFETTYNKANSFNKLLTSGSPDAQTYANVLKTLTGQQDAAAAAMLLTGNNAATFDSNVQKVSNAAKNAGKDVEHWGLIQQNFNQIWSVFQERLQVGAEHIGEILLPALGSLIKAIEWMQDHQQVFVALGVGFAAVGVALLTTYWPAVTAAAASTWALIAAAVAAAAPFIAIGVAAAAAAYLVITYWKQIAAFFSNLWSSVVKGAESMWGGVTGAFGQAFSIIGAALDQFKNHFFEDIGFAIGFVAGLAVKVIAAFVLMLVKGGELFLQLGATIINAIGNAINWISKINWLNVFSSIGGAIVNIGSNIWNTLTSAFNNFIHWITNINWGSLLVNAGKDLVNGLTHGITSMGSGTVDAIKNVGNGAVEAFKKALGIHSPSTVFMEIGQNMGQGLIQGLQGIQANANIAVNHLVAGSASASSPSSYVSSSSNNNNYTSYGGNSASTVIQNVNIYTPAAAQEFLKQLDRDAQLESMGLSPARGV